MDKEAMSVAEAQKVLGISGADVSAMLEVKERAAHAILLKDDGDNYVVKIPKNTVDRKAETGKSYVAFRNFGQRFIPKGESARKIGIQVVVYDYGLYPVK